MSIDVLMHQIVKKPQYWWQHCLLSLKVIPFSYPVDLFYKQCNGKNLRRNKNLNIVIKSQINHGTNVSFRQRDSIREILLDEEQKLFIKQ